MLSEFIHLLLSVHNIRYAELKLTSCCCLQMVGRCSSKNWCYEVLAEFYFSLAYTLLLFICCQHLRRDLKKHWKLVKNSHQKLLLVVLTLIFECPRDCIFRRKYSKFMNNFLPLSVGLRFHMCISQE